MCVFLILQQKCVKSYKIRAQNRVKKATTNINRAQNSFKKAQNSANSYNVAVLRLKCAGSLILTSQYLNLYFTILFSMTKPCICWYMFTSYASRNWHQLLSWVCARMGNFLCIFWVKICWNSTKYQTTNLSLKLVVWYVGFTYIYRTKFDAFSDIDNFKISIFRYR